MSIVTTPGPLNTDTLPAGISSGLVDNNNGLTMHLLAAGTPGKPLVLLLHGFPELAYSWRKVMLPLAEAGHYVIAPDQRGYGRTGGWDDDYDSDLHDCNLPNLAIDVLGLVAALGYREVKTLVGHDFGSPVAAFCALVRPDVFRSVVLMSAPFGGVPNLPFNSANEPITPASKLSLEAELATLPRPRKHYQWYYSTREANDNMWHCQQGVHDFMRAYYHFKSADWQANKPFRLKGWMAEEIAQLPTYYVMNKDEGMAETAAAEMPSQEEIEACQWLTEDEMAVYAAEYQRTGYQGGLQWYRCMTSEEYINRLRLFSGLTIDVPSMFIAGKSDWGIYQKPGAIEAMQEKVCTQMQDCHLIEGAGHWVQQEQAEKVSELLLDFISVQA